MIRFIKGLGLILKPGLGLHKAIMMRMMSKYAFTSQDQFLNAAEKCLEVILNSYNK